jgi:hypothetical protein
VAAILLTSAIHVNDLNKLYEKPCRKYLCRVFYVYRKIRSVLKTHFQFLLLFSFISIPALAQIGGTGTYKFLQLPATARITAVGGSLISVKDNDVSLGLENPSLLNDKMHNWLNLSMSPYFADIVHGSTAYARKFDKIGTGAIGMKFIQYGDMIEADQTGEILGTFTAGEYSFSAGLGREFTNTLSAGANIKFIYSTLADFTSTGTAIDAGISYFNPESNLGLALVVNNLGFQLKSYSGTREPLPVQVKMAISKKPEHLPLRFQIMFNNLQAPDMTYVNTEIPRPVNLETGEEEEIQITLVDKIARHIVVGGEFLLSENLHLRFGYNVQKRKEMLLLTRPGLVGFSYGAGVRINRFHLNYGRAITHVAGPAHHLSISTNFGEWVRKDDVGL